MEKKVLLKSDKSSFWVVDNFCDDYAKLLNLELMVKPSIIVYGQECHQQRDVGFFSDKSVGYRYSNTLTKSLPMNADLKELMEKVNAYAETKFNGILVNRYNNGAEYLSSHSDSEKGLDRNKMVAGLSFGCTRIFRIRKKGTKEKVLDVPLNSRMLYVMDGEFQKEYTHEIPIQKKIKEPRISLTHTFNLNIHLN